MNVEQASKRVMWEPSRLSNGEGRRRLEEGPRRTRATYPVGPTGVVATACVKEELISNTGSPGGENA